LPPTSLIWVVAGLLGGAALVVLGRAGAWGARIPPIFFALGIRVIAAVLIVVALLNVRAGSSLERYVFAPFALMLAIGVLRVRPLAGKRP
jgi:hypothetical protein